MTTRVEALQPLEATARKLLIERGENPDLHRMSGGNDNTVALWVDEAEEIAKLMQRLQSLGVHVMRQPNA